MGGLSLHILKIFGKLGKAKGFGFGHGDISVVADVRVVSCVVVDGFAG